MPATTQYIEKRIKTFNLKHEVHLTLLRRNVVGTTFEFNILDVTTERLLFEDFVALSDFVLLWTGFEIGWERFRPPPTKR